MRTTVALLGLMVAVGCADDADGDGASGTDSASSGTSAASADPTASDANTSDSSGETGAGTTGAGTSSGGSDSTGDGDSTGGSGSTSGADSTGGSSSDSSTGSDTTGGSDSSSGGGEVNDDPFDPESCGGTPITQADLTAALGGMERQILATATIQVRERTCPAGKCGDWGDAFDWVITYLTWSGGVSTHYKDFQADLQLVVFDDQGTPRLSLQHVTFDLPSSTYGDEDGMLYDLPPTPIDYAHVRAYDDDPDLEYYYQELDWMVRDGVLSVGEDCVRWQADPYVQQPPYTEQYAVVLHW